jgi:hypothetical protein
MEGSVFPVMVSLDPIPCLFIAFTAGDDNVAPVNPDTHVPARHEVGVTVMAEPAAVLAVNPAPLAHRDPPGKFHVPRGKFRIFSIHPFSLREQDCDTFPCDQFCRRFF